MERKKQKLDPPRSVFQFKVTLLKIDHPIWRRLAVPCNITFHKLHKILQVAMGWQDYHLYNFKIGDVYYGIPDPEFDFECEDSRRIKLEQVLKEKLKLIYVYDFGDNWEHEIQVERALPLEQGEQLPLCLQGKRACPPEDVGGTSGYSDFLNAISDPKHEEHESFLTWAGRKFDPEHFDIQMVNEKLRKLGPRSTSTHFQQKRMKIYFAGPLFSEAEREWIRSTIKQIESLAAQRGKKIEIIFRYDLITQSEIDSLGSKAKHEIFSRCKSHLDDADLLIALLDGSQVDDGTAWEIGYFYAIKLPEQKIIGIRTDFRRAGESQGAVVNAMIEGACDWIVRSREELMETISDSF